MPDFDFNDIDAALQFAIDNGFVETESEAHSIEVMLEAIRDGRVQIVAKVP